MIAVAVVARPGAASLPACLKALAAAGVDHPEVVEIGRDGPAVARNAALERCREEVIAYVEDDVLVPGGWLAALASAFADELVAVAGGPLEARVEGSRPAWLVDALLGGFGLGAGDTFHGGNIAFRAPALRGAGGFWPARGNPGQRDWFGVEHEAQRELRRAGWGSVLVPEAAAQRIVAVPSRPALLLERVRTGARARAVGGRPRQSRQLVRSAAGALAARRMERAARAAEALGTVLGPRVVRRELEPVASRTPFLPSVPAAATRRHPAGSGAPLVLLYHRLKEGGPEGLAVSPEHWRQQLEVLRASGRVAPLEDAGRGDIAITFDDGYADNVLLSDAGLPVTVFVATEHVREGRGFWWDAIRGLPREEVVRLGDRAFRKGDTRHLGRFLQGLGPVEVAAHLRTLGAAGDAADRPLTPDELRALAATPGVTIGAHTRRHPALRHIGEDRQREEIAGSRDDVEELVGARPRTFAYPFGVPGADFDETAVRLVREAGFTVAVANAPRTAGDRLCLPRRTVPDLGGEAFARWLEGALSRTRRSG